MVEGINEFSVEKIFIDKKKMDLDKFKSKEKQRLENLIKEIKTRIDKHILELKDHESIIELEWHDKKFLYITNLNCIIPKLNEFSKIITDIKNYSNINKMVEKYLGSKFIGDEIRWSIPVTDNIINIIAQKTKFPYFKNGNFILGNTKTACKVVVNSSKGKMDYDLLNRQLVNSVEGIFFPVLYLSESATVNTVFFRKHNINVYDLNSENITLKKTYEDMKTLDENSNKITFSKEEIEDYLLKKDFFRANIQEYSRNILRDPNKGYWDLDKEVSNNVYSKIKVKEKIYSRNSKLDIKNGGIIAIDFGTKSTVVMQEDNSNQVYPIRIGSGNFSKQIEEKDYENPTVMEFIDIKNFIDAYNQKDSRPDTKWQDLTVSHTAYNRIFESSSRDFSSIFSDLKQWAGESNKKIKIRDKNNFEFDLDNFLTINEKSINPIELYAYYIGLYINNMRNGIYLEYFLSFPVTYSKEVKEKIRFSFENGLKKSLPVGVLNDEEAMKKFKVVQGSSEPAAYAVTALLEYEFEPENEEKVFYGIFDFGGGTTDFDFGIWREADFDSVEEERYDYVIEHFGASGDRYLGGENLLELLAYEIFKQNKDKLLKNNIAFKKPIESKVFLGSENLISDSQEASLNSKKMMEELRPLWEKSEGWEEKYQNGSILINLYNLSGEQTVNFELELNPENLLNILKERIEKGVVSFFESLKNVFHNQELKDVKEINVFLGGNSSKSDIVLSLFEKYSLEISKDMKKNNVFKIHKPLEGHIDESTTYRPNGKTGVAYGIIKTKLGGKIKVVNKNVDSVQEDRFRYFVGKARKNNLYPVITPDCDSAWIRYFAATEHNFEIYYTTDPKATTNKLSIAESKKIRAQINNINTDANIYIKKIGLNLLNIVVATEKGIEEDKFIENLGTFKLD